MRIGIVGHGTMGREVEAVLAERGHQPVIVTRGRPFPAGCTVGIDFSAAEAVPGNVANALKAGARYVVGTTGWAERLAEVRAAVEEAGGGLVHAANFSLGVNLFYRVVREAAALLTRFPDYDPYVLERHHRRKKDAPSGTAKALAAILEAAGGRRRKAATALDGAIAEDSFHVASLRAGGIVGDHTVGFDSGGDEILLEHRARSRRGFALGAVLAAEWISSRTGFYAFDAVLEDLARS
ncbi:MAG: 4-hydroxy-tetrahydrodipicolinate reductase [Acidobacteria bacterium]|nr:4-hydroxy-tetrahydrodipicolinate reductase [Acidobacteriota bacterium]